MKKPRKVVILLGVLILLSISAGLTVALNKNKSNLTSNVELRTKMPDESLRSGEVLAFTDEDIASQAAEVEKDDKMSPTPKLTQKSTSASPSPLVSPHNTPKPNETSNPIPSTSPSTQPSPSPTVSASPSPSVLALEACFTYSDNPFFYSQVRFDASCSKGEITNYKWFLTTRASEGENCRMDEIPGYKCFEGKEIETSFFIPPKTYAHLRPGQDPASMDVILKVYNSNSEVAVSSRFIQVQVPEEKLGEKWW